MSRIGRRTWLAAAAGWAALGAARAASPLPTSPLTKPPLPPAPHEPFGRVDPPQALPVLHLSGEDGRPFELGQRLRGKLTAVQLMFTGCSATCPIQGALFAEVARRLPTPDSQLLSLSIDPLNDDAPALRGWLARFGATPAWHAAAPQPRDLDRLLDFLRGRAAGVDRHTAQTYLFDREARLVYRTPDLAPPQHVAELLAVMAHRG